MPPLVIVCGPPAAGKTMLATALGQQLGLPVVSKDLVKEAMMDHLGGAPAVGAAAFAVQFAIAKAILKSGVGLVLEGAFFRDQLEIRDLAALGDAIVVNLSCRLEVLERRYIERQGSRHASHRGLAFLPDLRARVAAGSYGVPALHRPELHVDTTNGFEPNEGQIVLWARQEMAVVARPDLTRDSSAPLRDLPIESGDLRAAWEQHAAAWTRWARKAGHDSYWRFGRAAFFKLLPPPGRLTVDVGCGEGRVSRDLRALGHRVVSIDASRSMIREATAADPTIPAVVADGAALPLVGGSCDLIVAYMSLHDMDKMQDAVTESARALEPRGHLCMAVVHPINSAGQFTGIDADAPFVIEGSYLSPHPYVDQVERDGLRMTFASQHYPMQSYFGALEKAGFLVESVREVTVDEASIDMQGQRERWQRLPMFLNVRAIKIEKG